jgi:hypothetical protein
MDEIAIDILVEDIFIEVVFGTLAMGQDRRRGFGRGRS